MVALKQARPSTHSAATFSRKSRENLLRRNRSAAHFSQSLQRARYYDPSTGEFTSRDPLEYVDGMSLFRAFFDLAKIDPMGLEWAKVSHSEDHWTPLEGGELLADLVSRVAPNLKSERNKSCIVPILTYHVYFRWPIHGGFFGRFAPNQKVLRDMKSKWRNHQGARCGVYDVSNLLDRNNGGDVKAAIGNDTNGYIQAAAEFYGARRMSPAELAKLLEEQSGTGKTPLMSAVLIGHGFGREPKMGGDNGSCPGCKTFLTLPAAEIVWQFPKFDDAAATILPMGCWFRTDATIRLVGCRTNPMAERIASVLLRGNAKSFGTETLTWYLREGDGVKMGWASGHMDAPRPHETPWASTPTEYHTHEYWTEYPAKN